MHQSPWRSRRGRTIACSKSLAPSRISRRTKASKRMLSPRRCATGRSSPEATDRPCIPLLHLHERYILMHMRTTLNIDDALLAEAQRLTRLKEKTAVVHAGLEAVIARDSARRLAALGGSDPAAR